MPDTYTWVTVPVAELSLNLLGRRCSMKQEGMSLEGALTGFVAMTHDGHTHIAAFVRTGKESGTQLEFDGSETVRLSLEKEE